MQERKKYLTRMINLNFKVKYPRALLTYCTVYWRRGNILDDATDAARSVCFVCPMEIRFTSNRIRKSEQQ